MFCVANFMLHNMLLSNELQYNQQSTKRLHGLLRLHQGNGKQGREQLSGKNPLCIRLRCGNQCTLQIKLTMSVITLLWFCCHSVSGYSLTC